MAKFSLKTVFGMLIMAGCGSVASAQSDGDAFIILGSQTEAPKGFVEMCSGDRTFCAAPIVADPGDSRLVTGALADRSAGRFVPDTRTQIGKTKSVVEASWSHAPGRTASFRSVAGQGTRETFVPVAWFGVAQTAAGPFLKPDADDVTRGRTADFHDTLLRWAGWSSNAMPLSSLPVMAVVASPETPAPRAADSEIPASVHDVPDAASLLRRINEFVNARVAQKTDLQVYGRDEVWRRSGVGRHAAGDCEDIAIEKRYQLLDAGFPADQLYFAVVYERQVGLHAVLVARTTDGDYVLDSRTPYVKRWDRTSYTFVSIQSPAAPMEWHALSAESLRIAQQVDGTAPKAG